LIEEESGKLSSKINDQEANKDQLKVLHEAIKKVSEDIEALRFNTAISALMIFVNEANQWDSISRSVAKDFVILLSPFAPHISEEIWRLLGNSDTIAYAEWPAFNEEYLKADSILYPIQVNGKVRSDLEVPADKAMDKDYVLTKAKEDSKIADYLKDSVIVKEIFVPKRIINLVIKPS
jgi:leucyl-tRNA synthetase